MIMLLAAPKPLVTRKEILAGLGMINNRVTAVMAGGRGQNINNTY